MKQVAKWLAIWGQNKKEHIILLRVVFGYTFAVLEIVDKNCQDIFLQVLLATNID